MTNEFVFGYTFIGFPNVFEDPSQGGPHRRSATTTRVCSRTAWPRSRPSADGAAEKRRWSSTRAVSKRAGRQSGLYADKYMPSFSDTVTKVWGTHTIKAGVFWERIRNAQPANNNTNGLTLDVTSATPNSLGNAYADLLTGTLNSYQRDVLQPHQRHLRTTPTKASFRTPGRSAAG